jgi:hypothetical protein
VTEGCGVATARGFTDRRYDANIAIFVAMRGFTDRRYDANIAIFVAIFLLWAQRHK